MKKSFIVAGILFSTLSFGFDLKQIASDVAKNIPQNVETTGNNQKSNLDNSTISNGLKEALKNGVTYATSTLGKDNGYLNSDKVKIPLPDNLKNVEGVIRKAGGDKMVDDLINSMNAAASKAAPKTADIFMNAISKMNLNDAQTILSGKDNAATEYFKKNSSNELKAMIKPIVQESMKTNNVAQYYDVANNFYQNSAKGLVGNSSITGLAKNFGVDSYVPGNNNESLDDYITEKAMDGLFSMIAQKEAGIRKNPLEQTSSILKEVFSK
ncbi:DUF4197 domain-containing protein [Aliarcobacter cibarius]|uniref:DUF4197 domain-containing protein n=1 Tax=Aliarcobacter cibarius TaxID=255507 RepID=UPI0010FE9761|nr:DUF4197 domain-containing protein [Aliarcobacter cibarius]TLT03455.1 DUF4197 domain-containing protein [Aliarcobacter cibarius]